MVPRYGVLSAIRGAPGVLQALSAIVEGGRDGDEAVQVSDARPGYARHAGAGPAWQLAWRDS
ncbi:hypothetical protein [Pseudomaricurvus sp. HS19]|uniref:hypothetical protein n=1 Tax=Pseudomaricurvus sp. HS19 TaxID=2692626 RepID=UPI0013691A9E|nr:hypothetical protein [Pseudomaricurvus sp. HS19]MYM61919.1 hypothetical protein [Pseudomaricurvus sp. HS19]